MMIGINTNDILIAEDEDSLKVRVSYSLDINYQHVLECNINLDILTKVYQNTSFPDEAEHAIIVGRSVELGGAGEQTACFGG